MKSVAYLCLRAERHQFPNEYNAKGGCICQKKNLLGRTGLEVSRLALGGLFTSSYGGELQQSIETIRRAIELGVNYIDTAPGYFDSEEVIGKALASVHTPVIISTKLGGRPKPFDPKDKNLLRQSFEQSCKNLGRDVIDILFVHDPDRPGQYNWWNGPDNYQGPVLELLHELKDEGRIKAIGLGGTTAYKMTRLAETGLFDVLLTAANYSILWREAEIELLPAAKKHGVSIVAGTPLQQGALATRYDRHTIELSASFLFTQISTELSVEALLARETCRRRSRAPGHRGTHSRSYITAPRVSVTRPAAAPPAPDRPAAGRFRRPSM